MIFIRKLLSKQCGMTMAEMVIAGALTGAAAMGVASLMKSMGGSSKDAETVIERTEFGSSMGVFLNSAKGCFSMQKGAIVPTSEQAYTTVDWVESSKPKSFTFNGFKNFQSNMDLRYNNIKYLTAQRIDITDVPPITISTSSGNKTLQKAMIKFKLGLTKMANERDPAKKRAEEDKFPEAKFEYNIPVMVNNSSGVIEICGDNTTMAEACFVLKGLYDAETDKCELPKSCESFGTYSVVNCAPKYKSVSCADYSRGTPQKNPITGNYNCPNGSTPISTGGQTWYKDIDCGKKCTARVNFSIGYYSCLKCDD